eukprot:482498-Lingulodinium_polyedra.AAC.1
MVLDSCDFWRLSVEGLHGTEMRGVWCAPCCGQKWHWGQGAPGVSAPSAATTAPGCSPTSQGTTTARSIGRSMPTTNASAVALCRGSSEARPSPG